MKTKKKRKSPKKKEIKRSKTEDETALEVITKEEKGIELDPRRQKFASFYLDPSSTTYCNALQSALRAGFSQEYSESILYKKSKWLVDIVGKLGILDKLKSNLEYHVNLNPVVQATGPFGPLFKTEGKGKNKRKVPIMVESNTRLKMRQEITQWALEKLHPDFKKHEKGDFDPVKVEIKQIIILAPDGQRHPYNQAGAQTIPSLPGATI